MYYTSYYYICISIYYTMRTSTCVHTHVADISHNHADRVIEQRRSISGLIVCRRTRASPVLYVVGTCTVQNMTMAQYDEYICSLVIFCSHFWYSILLAIARLCVRTVDYMYMCTYTTNTFSVRVYGA